MKKRLSKWLALCLALMMVFSFAACGGTPATTSGAASGSAGSSQPTDAEPVTLTV